MDHGAAIIQDSAEEMRVPTYWQSIDWPKLVADYPPPPDYFSGGSPTTVDVRVTQERRVLARIQEAWEVPFYRRRWTDAGLSPGDITSIDDIQKIPPFSAADLKASIEERPPYGLHHPFGAEKFGSMPIKIATSGGTTGRPRATLFDPVAFEVQAIQGARALWAAGARPGDVVQIPRTLSLANAGWLYYAACHHWLGCVPLTTGSGAVTSSEEQLEAARTFGTVGWTARAEYLGRLVTVAKEIGFDLHQL